MKLKYLISLFWVTLCVGCLVACSDKEDAYELPAISQAIGNYACNFTVYKDGKVTDKGECTIKIDLLFDEMHDITLQSSKITIENQSVSLDFPCKTDKKEKVYSISGNQKFTIPVTIGFIESNATITGEFDGRTLKFEDNITVKRPVDKEYQIKIVFEGKR